MKNADLLIVGAGELATFTGPVTGRSGPDLDKLEIIENGAIAICDGRILASRTGTNYQ